MVGRGRAVADAGRQHDAQVDREHRRQRHALGLDAVFDLARDLQRVGVAVPHHARGEGRLRQVEQAGHTLGDLVALTVLRQLARDQQVGALLAEHRGDQLRDALRVELRVVGVDHDRAVGPHGQEVGHVLALGRGAHAHDHDLGEALGAAADLREAQRGLDRVLVELVLHPLGRRGVDLAAGELRRLHRIGNPFDGHQDLHEEDPPCPRVYRKAVTALSNATPQCDPAPPSRPPRGSRGRPEGGVGRPARPGPPVAAGRALR
ncbi:MAG: hypothetical protein U0168_06245 [Nannocystaceae bacterium]